MIELSRLLAHQLHTVLRKSVWAGVAKDYRAVVVVQAGRDGLRIRAQSQSVAVEYHRPGAYSPDTIALPAKVLQDIEGKKNTVVTLEATALNTIQARWDDAGVPQVKDYDAVALDKQPSFPDLPNKFTTVVADLLSALNDAAQTAAREEIRYALHHLQLRGASGEIVATDGRQLLVQKGFSISWKDDLLVPALAVFGSREIATDEPIGLGRTDKHVVLRIGPWTICLTIATEGRYPRYEQIIPSATAAVTHWQIHPEDADFLERAIPRLPGADDPDQPVTVDLDGGVTVRTRASGQSRSTELFLARSSSSGKPVRYVINREYLARAMRLRFAEMHLVKPETPVLFQDAQRQYVVMPLDAKGALGPSDDSVRIVSAEEKSAHPATSRERKKPIMSKPQSNGNGHADLHHEPVARSSEKREVCSGSVIAEAQALKAVLRDAYRQSSRLVSALRRQKKQSKLVANTIASLRQLQHIDT